MSFVDDIAESVAADRLDDDGRPLGELASPRYDDVTTEVVRCPYAGARHGLPMNRTALRQVSRVWPDVLRSARWLAGPDATVHRAWWAAMAAIAAPQRCSADRPIPTVLSALYKASLGFGQVLTAILLTDDDLADRPLASLGDASAFLDLLEHGRWLVGDVQACAGPPAQIAALFEALAGITPETEAPSALSELVPVDGWADRAATVVGLQCAAIGAAYRATRREDTVGEPLSRWMTTPRAPCLRAWLTVPDRPPEHVRRLFPTGRTPGVVERLLASDLDDAGAIASALTVALADVR